MVKEENPKLLLLLLLEILICQQLLAAARTGPVRDSEHGQGQGLLLGGQEDHLGPGDLLFQLEEGTGPADRTGCPGGPLNHQTGERAETQGRATASKGSQGVQTRPEQSRTVAWEELEEQVITGVLRSLALEEADMLPRTADKQLEDCHLQH